VKLTSNLLAACALGAAFGAATSLSNGLASPFEPDSYARLPSLILDAGWAWAALAVAAGLRADAPARGAALGVAALLAATTVYYGTDSMVRDEPLAWYWPELLRWYLASLAFGPALGGVGAYAKRPGLTGLLARLAVPVGAAAQMIVLPPGSGAAPLTPDLRWAQVIVLVAAGVAVALVVTHFLLAVRSRGRSRRKGAPRR